jgi:transposase InsO family protein
MTDVVDGFLAGHRLLICDRDRKWTDGFRRIVQGAGVRIVLTPAQAPNANAYAERFVRSIREECLDRLILFGERRLLRALDEFVTTTGSETIRASGMSDHPGSHSRGRDPGPLSGPAGRAVAVLPPRGLSM